MSPTIRTTDPGGREAFLIRTEAAEALVAPLGAQLLSWHVRGRDVLWTASRAEYGDKPVRGGVPVVFPWFGTPRTGQDLPPHGFARNRPWRPVAAAATGTGAGADPGIALELGDDETTRTLWPWSFHLRLAITLAGGALRLEFEIENRDTRAMPCEAAFHTYFAVGDVHTASVHGLENVPFTEHAAAPEPTWDPAAPLRFRAETDRVFRKVPSTLELRAPTLTRRILLSTEDLASAIVWNPWPAKTARLSQMAPDDWQRFVCVESGNVHEHAMVLAPGARRRLVLELRCEDGGGET
ncbi:MAG: D-hexose-6-phosphate mutarotase [Planctomycetes bacterium]|nr:D-hexose-6-phosphate mutarotase [Planctomycetota bacterium]